MTFEELIQSAGLNPLMFEGPDAPVRAVLADSRRIHHGDCFVAVCGQAADGHQFIPQAVDAGAAAVVCRNPENVPEGFPHAVLEDTQAALGPLAQASLGWPARRMKCIGVTGTNGKSTVAVVTAELLRRLAGLTGLIGTIFNDTGARRIESGMTTPDAADLAVLMDEMVVAGCGRMVMEVSSHALDQRREAGIDFAAAVFTNLTGDHLDYHGTMDAYFQAKARLFEGLEPTAKAILNADDPHSGELAERAGGSVWTYGLTEAADFRAKNICMKNGLTYFDLDALQSRVAVRTPLIGAFNVSNILASIAAVTALGFDPTDIAEALADIPPVRGRLQRVPTSRPIEVVVDYAHTDDALVNVLQALRPITHRRLICVFGCGGDRDRSKRPRMGRAAEELADVLVVTSDNPRSEEPEAIVDDILEGLHDPTATRVHVQPDRRKAIGLAIDMADDGDVVLLAGKGHETYQIIGQQRLDFDDVAVAAEFLRKTEETPET